MLPVRDFTDKNWIFEQYRQTREIDFKIVELKGLHVEIHTFEGVEQPIVYKPDNVHAMPYYSSDANAANQLLQELPRPSIHIPNQRHNQWILMIDCEECDERGFKYGLTYCDVICKSWISWKEWLKTND